jgi:glycosyltransferase involved in cell wall biosynthesis
MPRKANLVILQYAGDYREAAQRLAANGPETYYAQKYSVDAVAALAPKFTAVAVVCCLTSESYDEVLPNGVRAVGAGCSGDVDERRVVSLIERLEPQSLILRTPMPGVMRWATARRVRTLATLADSFSRNGLRSRVRNYRLAALFNHPGIEWILNHGLSSCVSLRNIGVSPEKIVPWDWPSLVVPNPEPKSLRQGADEYGLFYAGLLSEAKGLGDLLDAIAILSGRGIRVRLKAAGSGDAAQFIARAEALAIRDSVDFLGLVPHKSIQQLMRQADAVIVPSRHEYPEGFPMTIYEALCSRTPLVASDHPMFRAGLADRSDSLIFPAGRPSVLANCIFDLLRNPDLYRTLSTATVDAWTRLQLPVKWADAVERWVSDSPDDRSWLLDHRLSSGLYPLDKYLQAVRQ